MKRIIHTIVLFLIALQSFGQMQHQVDSVKAILAKETDPIKRFSLYSFLSQAYTVNGKLDSVPVYTNELFKIAALQKNDSLLMRSYRAYASFLDFKSESRQEIEYLLKALKIAEQKYISVVPNILIGLGSAYSDLQNYSESLKYLNKAQGLMLAKSDENKNRFTGLYFQLANAYSRSLKLDSALHYVQRANEQLLKFPSTFYRSPLFRLTGRIYEQLGDDQLAETYYLKALSDSTKNYNTAMTAADYSKLLFRHGNYDKAKYYGLKGLDVARASHAKIPFLESVKSLRLIYKASNKNDSAYYFASLELAYRDSLFNQEKINAVQDMTLSETIRQNEEAIKQSDEALQRKHNLQYAAIAFGLVTFVLLFFLLSHSVIANQKLIRFLGILALLIVFEFLNLLLHPFLDKITNHQPVLMLLAMVCVAALLIPLHHKLEHWITHKMVEKNNKIRLAAAKKTIAQLEAE